MIAKFTDQHGHTVPVNVDNFTFAGAAQDAKTGAMAIGLSVLFFIGGTSCVVKGSTDEIYGALRKLEHLATLHALNGDAG